MSELKVVEELFKGRHFDRRIVILCVRWYLRYKLSLRDLVEMMAERGLSMAHTTIMRWVQRLFPREPVLPLTQERQAGILASAPRMKKFLKLRSQDD
jgi:transposase-like protein